MHSHIVVGLAFGDEGKGSWVDHLSRRHTINTVVRFNGGAQALHHVTTEAGVTHGFAQFGSHSFIPGAKTMLSRYMLIEPIQLMLEAAELVQKGVNAPLRRLFINSEAPIIPISNVLLNQIMELARGSARHGSCGLGIGLTQRDIDEGNKPVIRAGDLLNRVLVRAKFREHLALTQKEVQQWPKASGTAPYKQLCQMTDAQIETYIDRYCGLAQLATIVPEAAFLSVLRRTPAIFEGAQGAMLDQYQGTFPHCTRSTTTPANAEQLLQDAGFSGQVTRHGLFRAYGTRHGAGPFPTEDAALLVPQCDNAVGQWQGVFRTGWFDAVLARTALEFSVVDEVVVTNLDRLDGLGALQVATGYRGLDSSFYNEATRSLVPVTDYEQSAKRTEALFSAQPHYESLAGFVSAEDVNHEHYLRFIEQEIGQPIKALSRRKDHHKIYRT